MPAGDTPLVSVVLPAYNAAATIRPAVESILNQTWKNLELIIIDDRSTDDTAEILQAMGRLDQRVRLTGTTGPHGLVAALRKGTAQAEGTLIARMDADDLCHPERLEKQVRFLEENPHLSACGTMVEQTGALGEGICRYVDWSNSLLHPREIEQERFVESPLVHPSVMMEAESFRSIGGYRDPGWAEDYDLWLRMLDAGLKLAKVPESLLQWSDRPDRLTRTDERYSEDHFLKAKAHFLNRLPEAEARGFAICGAGPTGKRLGRFLRAEGARIHAYFDVHPRRIGAAIGKIPVLGHREIPAFRNTGLPILIAALGKPGAKQRLRRQIHALGYSEGADFFAAA